MAADMDTLLKIFDEAISNGMESAITKYGSQLSDAQKADLRKMTEDEIKETYQNLLAAKDKLAKPAWFDTNNNNH